MIMIARTITTTTIMTINKNCERTSVCLSVWTQKNFRSLHILIFAGPVLENKYQNSSHVQEVFVALPIANWARWQPHPFLITLTMYHTKTLKIVCTCQRISDSRWVQVDVFRASLILQCQAYKNLKLTTKIKDVIRSQMFRAATPTVLCCHFGIKQKIYRYWNY